MIWVVVVLATLGGWAVLMMPVSWTVGQRRCNRLNAENDLRWEYWNALLPEDREWLLEMGATEPSLIHWEMR